MISLDYAKAHLRTETDEEDGLIEEMVGSATRYIERRTGWMLGSPREVTRHLIGFGTRTLWLHQPPLDPEAVTVADGDDVIEDFAVRGARLVRTDGVWRRGVEYTVTAEFGFATGEAPPDMRQACALVVAGWHRDREGWVSGTIVSDHKHSIDRLLGAYERIRA